MFTQPAGLDQNFHGPSPLSMEGRMRRVYDVIASTSGVLPPGVVYSRDVAESCTESLYRVFVQKAE